MTHVTRTGVGFLLLLCLPSCATTQSRFAPLGPAHAPRAAGSTVDVYHEGLPSRPFVRVARLDVHIERTHFVGSSLKSAMPELLKQARQAGADAIVEIRERRSTIGETKAYHVTATGVKYGSP